MPLNCKKYNKKELKKPLSETFLLIYTNTFPFKQYSINVSLVLMTFAMEMRIINISSKKAKFSLPFRRNLFQYYVSQHSRYDAIDLKVKYTWINIGCNGQPEWQSIITEFWFPEVNINHIILPEKSHFTLKDSRFNAM